MKNTNIKIKNYSVRSSNIKDIVHSILVSSTKYLIGSPLVMGSNIKVPLSSSTAALTKEGSMHKNRGELVDCITTKTQQQRPWKETLSTTSTSPKTTKYQYGSDNNNQHYTSSDRNCQQNHAIIFLSIPKDRHQLLNKPSLSANKKVHCQ
jgi:hypothetical protein